MSNFWHYATNPCVQFHVVKLPSFETPAIVPGDLHIYVHVHLGDPCLCLFAPSTVDLASFELILRAAASI